MNESWLLRLYKASLSLYPPGFRGEFSDEMGEVFSQATEDARRRSRYALLEVILAELRDLPTSLLHAHRRARSEARRSLKAAAANLRQLSPVDLTWQELLATLAVFLIPAAVLLTHDSNSPGALTQTTSTTVRGLPSAILFLFAMLVVGLLRRLPLRSLPYLGATLVIAAYLFLFQWVADLIGPTLITSFAPGPWERSTYLLLKVISHGMLWLTLFCLTLLVIALLALYNRFQPLCWSIRHDSSVLSFILHGEAVFTLLLLAERHRSERPFAIACLLWLAAGAWFYLRSSGRWKRAIALMGGFALGAWAVAFGDTSFMGTNNGFQSILVQLWADAGRVLFLPLWILLVLLLPAWYSRLYGFSRFIRNRAT